MELLQIASSLFGTLSAFATLSAICWRQIKKLSKTIEAVEELSAIVDKLSKQVTAQGEGLELLKKANKAALRSDIIHRGEAYIARGYVTIKELEEFNSDFETYSIGLGGNGSAATVHRAVNNNIEIRAA